jgi:hypothetical protein
MHYNMLNMKISNVYSCLFIIILLIVWYYYYTNHLQLECIISNVNGETYCVRDNKNKSKSVNLIAKVSEKCKKLVDYCKNKYPKDERIKRLYEKFDPSKMSETLPNSEYTAYSENKGEKLAFCLNTYKNKQKLIDINTLMFVAIHELSHIMTKSEGHKQEFWYNFKFLLENAVDCGVYSPVDYKKNPQAYCGMDISDNPLYDL